LYAAWRRPDVLHVHAIGPALFTPLARLLGLRVVVTHHGPDYDREKWSSAAKAILRTGERMGMRYANARIVISNVIRELVRRKYQRESYCITNGVEIPAAAPGGDTLRELGLAPGRYILTVSRMVPEKRHLDLIAAFKRSKLPGWKLAVVGDLSAEDDYVGKVREAAADSPGVVLTGFRKGGELAEIYANAGVFVLPSTHEGLPIALLEALSYGLPSIASDIPANLEVGLEPAQYFPVGDIQDLATCLKRVATRQRSADYPQKIQDWVRRKYDWQSIAQDTLAVYQAVCQRRLPHAAHGTEARD
jgi:glycosyltransferase involved in cell wall biosynthesis